MTRLRRSVRMSAVAAVLLVAATACGSDPHEGAPDLDAGGMFPAHPSAKSFAGRGATLLKATAADPNTMAYTFDIDVPDDQAIAVVGVCTTGQMILDDAAFGACTGNRRGVIGYCTGGHFHVDIAVSEPQRRPWGLAIYSTSTC